VEGKPGKEHVTSRRKRCPSCNHSWLDKYGKDECPKCLRQLSGATHQRRQVGEPSTYKQAAGSAMESNFGSCPEGGLHSFKFGKCSKCKRAEGGIRGTREVSGGMTGACPKGGKHVYKFTKCTKCGAPEF